MKTALTIAGSDSCGGAGIQVDLKVFTVLGVYGMSVLTALTAQNTTGVKAAMEVSSDFIRKQIDTTATDIAVDATKTGMLATAGIIETVADAIGTHNLVPYVCDPVMVSKAGSVLLDPDAILAMKKKLFPLAAVITPNRRETAALTGMDAESLTTIAGAKDAAKRLVDLGARAAVVKAIEVGDQTVDVFYDGHDYTEFASNTQPSNKTHGSGCAFSAAITAGLANRLDLKAAIDQAKALVSLAIQHSDGQGRGVSPVNVLAFAPKKK